MDGEPLRMGYGMSGRPLRTDRIIHPWNMMNRTAKTYEVLFPAVPDHEAVRHRHLVTFGLPESGKTQLLNSLAWECQRRYGKDNVNLIAVYKIGDALDLIDQRKVQLLICDDAVKQANSRKAMSNADDVADFYEVRHIFERKAESMSGVVITVWAAQRFYSLDIVFRNAHVIMFKTCASDPQDKREILRYIGPSAYRKLEEITSRIYEKADDLAKSESIVHFPFSSETGTFRHELRPKVLDFDRAKGSLLGEKPERFFFDDLKVLDAYMKEREWKKEARAYYLSRVEKLTQEKIAKDPLIKCSRENVTKLIQKMQGEISRLAGEEYELWKAAQLEAAGLQVRRRGSTGSPDILAERPDGRKYVYSCKCLHIHRKTSLPIEEIRPEVLEALRSGRILILSVHNLADGTEQELTIDAKDPPANIELRPDRTDMAQSKKC
ncbi:MAG: hypothetical protein WC375_09955 [Methanomassiliicoccales archaeon]|jgi:hypothetical protein